MLPICAVFHSQVLDLLGAVSQPETHAVAITPIGRQVPVTHQ